MSVYVGIDVHRKRSQVAVVDQAGQVLVNPGNNTVRRIPGIPAGRHHDSGRHRPVDIGAIPR
jgi:hypothetical protein